MDGIPPLSLLDGGTTIAILVILIYGYMSDRIVAGRRLREERAEKREALDIVKGQGEQLEKLLVGVELQNKILRSLPHPTDKESV